VLEVGNSTPPGGRTIFFFEIPLLSLTDTTATIPKIKAVHASVVAKRGSNVTLKFVGRDVRGLDTNVQWKFNGQIIKEDTTKKAKVKYRQLPDGRRKGFFSLHITNVSEEDVGEYVCRARVGNYLKLDDVEDSIELSLYKGEFHLLMIILRKVTLT